MDVASIAITAAVTLLGVTLGEWLSVWNQDRIWRREYARQWRDIRLSAYKDFLSAYRAYLAFVQDPSSKITAVPHPRRPDELMPFLMQKAGHTARSSNQPAWGHSRLAGARDKGCCISHDAARSYYRGGKSYQIAR